MLGTRYNIRPGGWQPCSRRRRGNLMTPQVAGYGAGDSSRVLCWAHHATGAHAASNSPRVHSSTPKKSPQGTFAPSNIWSSVSLTERSCRPIGLAYTDVDDAVHLVVAGTWAWCWDLFVRGVLSLDRRPSMMPRLRPPPQVVEPVDIASLGRVTASSIVGYDPTAPLAAVRISDKDDRSDFLVEVRKLARPEPAYGWLGDSPIVPRGGFADSPVPTTAQHRRRSNGLHNAESGLITPGGGKQGSLRRATSRLPDGSGLLPARHVTRDHRYTSTAERPAVEERWPHG